MKISILLADGRKLFREALSLLLEKQHNICIVGEAEDLGDVPRLLHALVVDIVIVNVNSPAHLDASRVRAICARPGVRLIVLAAAPPMEFVQTLLDAGALGLLTKECAGGELVAAVGRVMEGTVYLSPSLVDKMVTRFVCPRTGTSSYPRLAPREREVLRFIAAGASTKEIAANLGVSTKTIETHRRRIMEKLNRHSVAELTKYAVLEGLTALETPHAV